MAFWPKEFSQAAYKAEGQAWTATSHCLTLLRQMGLDPASATSRTLRDQVGRIALWEKGDQPFWQGETGECINGRTLSDGVYFGADVSGIAARLITERQADGRWNCDRCRGTLRSSFANTINVLEGRSAFEQATGITPALRAALEAGQDYLLTRQLFRRASNGAVVDPDVLVLCHPWRWHYDILRALEYIRTSGVSKDRRLQQAADLLESRRLADGRWLLEPTSRGRVWFQR